MDFPSQNLRVALFIPCYVDQFYPQVARATLRLLQKLGLNVHYPLDQTCCGQPLANSGLEQDARDLYRNMARNFEDCDYIVAPSGSCVLHVKEHYDIVNQDDSIRHLRTKIFELSEFLVDVVKVETFGSMSKQMLEW